MEALSPLNAPVVYFVRPASPGARLFAVTCRIENPGRDGQTVSLPAWIPGSYLIRDYARHVIQFAAECDGDPIPVRKLDKHTWRIAPSPGPVLVRITVYAADPSVRGAWLDHRSGFFNGVCLFLRVHDRERQEHVVHIDPPEEEPEQGWQLATSMPRLTGSPGEFGAFRASGYEDLIDHPVLMGALNSVEYLAADVPHALVLHGLPDPDRARLQQDLATLCTWHVDFFGRPVPMDRYLFLVRVSGGGYGGLEHRFSAVLSCRADDIPRQGSAVNEAGYRRFLGLVSHEYFHAWHVKRIRPAEFAEADLASEAYTRQLWIFEGITAYYDDLALRRSGLITTESYLELLGRSLTQLYRTEGRRQQTLEEASFDAWIKFYRPDENTQNATVSYYLKGSVVALALDLEIRLRTGGACSLDDVMRALWRNYGQADSAGLGEGQFEQLAASVSGMDLEDFFRQALRTTIDPPLGILLAQFGIRMHFRSAESDSDPGGSRGRREDQPRAWLGFRVQAREGRLQIIRIAAGGPAERAGLLVGDELVACDARQIGPDNWESTLDGLRLGAGCELHVFRHRELMSVRLLTVTAPRDTCYLSRDTGADQAAKARGNAWLGTEDNSPTG